MVQQTLLTQGFVRGRLGRQRRMGEEAQMAQAVVDADQQHAVPSEGRAVIEGQGACAHPVRAAVQPDHDRHGRGGIGGRPDVQRQAVFAGRFGRAADGDDVGYVGRPSLGRRLSELGRLTHAFPFRVRLGRPPAQIADRCGGVWNAAKHIRRTLATAAKVARWGRHDRMSRSVVDLIHCPSLGRSASHSFILG